MVSLFSYNYFVFSYSADTIIKNVKLLKKISKHPIYNILLDAWFLR